MRRWLRWTGIALVSILLGGVAWGIVAMRQADHITMLALAHGTIQPAAWVFEQGFYRLHPTPEEIQDCNRRAAAEWLLTQMPEPQARRLLAHYIAAGLDINRPSLESPLLTTALHAVTQYDHAWYTRVLLDFGARVDVRDAKGQTPLDWARRWQSRFPDDPEGVEKVRLLEAAERRQGRGSPPQAAASVPQAASMPR